MKKILLTLALGLTILIANAQTDVVGKKYIYEFRDGTTIIGTFIKDADGNIYITELDGKETYLPRVMVAQIHEVTDDNIKNGEYWFPNLHDSRYFFSPSAFGLEKGEGYFGHSYWVMRQAQFGITDDFSIGAGVMAIVPITLNAKYSFNIKEDINAAAGWFWVGDLFGWFSPDPIDERTIFNMPYAVITKGSKENNITLGAAYNFGGSDDDNDEVDFKERLVLNAGGTFRMGRRFAFVFEAWLLDPMMMTHNEPQIIGGPGIRYYRKINRVTARNGAGAKTFDFQLVHFPDLELKWIPMFGASQKF